MFFLHSCQHGHDGDCCSKKGQIKKKKWGTSINQTLASVTYIFFYQTSDRTKSSIWDSETMSALSYFRSCNPGSSLRVVKRLKKWHTEVRTAVHDVMISNLCCCTQSMSPGFVLQSLGTCHTPADYPTMTGFPTRNYYTLVLLSLSWGKLCCT